MAPVPDGVRVAPPDRQPRAWWLWLLAAVALLAWLPLLLAGGAMAWNRALDACTLAEGSIHTVELGEQMEGAGYRVGWSWTPPGWACQREDAAGRVVGEERIGLVRTFGAPAFFAALVLGLTALVTAPIAVSARRRGLGWLPGAGVAAAFLAGAGLALTLVMVVGNG